MVMKMSFSRGIVALVVGISCLGMGFFENAFADAACPSGHLVGNVCEPGSAPAGYNV